jgi:hypothetical protein
MKSLSLEKTSRVKLMVLENKKFVVREYEISFSLMTPVSEADKPMGELQLDQNISFAKAICFIDAVFNNSILITHENMQQYEKTLCEYSNNFVLLPDVADTTIIHALYNKLSSIVSELTEVTSVTVTDLDDHLKYRLDIYETEEESDELPSITEWLGDLAFNEQPWWKRSDESTWDGVAKDPEELEIIRSSKPDESEETTMFEDIEESITSLFKSLEKEAKGEEVGEIIEVDFNQEPKKKTKKWKPTII